VAAAIAIAFVTVALFSAGRFRLLTGEETFQPAEEAALLCGNLHLGKRGALLELLFARLLFARLLFARLLITRLLITRLLFATFWAEGATILATRTALATIAIAAERTVFPTLCGAFGLGGRKDVERSLFFSERSGLCHRRGSRGRGLDERCRFYHNRSRSWCRSGNGFDLSDRSRHRSG
jgi:hypothetical protein